MIFEQLPEFYAKALLELTSGKEEEYINYFQYVNEIIYKDHQIKNFFLNPATNKDVKIQVIKKVFSEYLPEIMINFLCVLVKNNRIELLPQIEEVYIYYYDQKNNIFPVKVITAVDLEDDLKKNIKQELDKYFNKKTDIKFIVKPQIIGGIVIQAEGKEIDTSIFTKLKQINNNLKSIVKIGVGYED